MQISLVFSFLWEPADVILPGFRFLWTFICRFTFVFVSLHPINLYKMKQIYIIAMLAFCMLTGCKNDKKQAEEEANEQARLDKIAEETGVSRRQTVRYINELTEMPINRIKEYLENLIIKSLNFSLLINSIIYQIPLLFYFYNSTLVASNTGPSLQTCPYLKPSSVKIFVAHPKHAPTPHPILSSKDISV